MPRRNLQIRVLPQGLFAQTPSVIPRIVRTYDVVNPKIVLILLKNFFNFWFGAIGLQSIINLSRYGGEGYA